jgi:hypothetical protein
MAELPRLDSVSSNLGMPRAFCFASQMTLILKEDPGWHAKASYEIADVSENVVLKCKSEGFFTTPLDFFDVEENKLFKLRDIKGFHLSTIWEAVKADDEGKILFTIRVSGTIRMYSLFCS